jgi:serine phosphatase RsbU (regulator of sigma subunit)
MKWTLNKKITVIFSLLLIIALGTYSLTVSRSRTENLVKNQIRAAVSLFTTIAGTTSSLSAYHKSYSTFRIDNYFKETVLRNLSETANLRQDIFFMSIMSSEGKIIVDTNRKIEGRKLQDILGETASESEKAGISEFLLRGYTSRSPDVYMVGCQKIRKNLPSNDCLLVRTPLYVQGVFIGTYFGALNLSSLAEGRQALILNTVFFVLALFVLFFLLVLLFSHSLTRPLSRLAAAVKDFQEKKYLFEPLSWKGHDEIAQLTNSFNEMGTELGEAYKKLQNKILLVNEELQAAHDELKVKNQNLEEKQARINESLEYAAEIQNAFLPPNLIFNKIEIHSLFKPLDIVSGDYFAYRYSPANDDKFGIGIGDVTGHGVPAAFGMIRLRDAFLHAPQELDSPARVLEELNQIIVKEFSSKLQTTFLFATLNFKEKNLLIASGAHPYVIRIREKKAIELKAQGMLLGVDEKFYYDNYKFDLKPGDFFFLYTDGVSEIKNSSNKMLTLAGLKGILEKVYDPDSKLKLISDKIIQELQQYQNSSSFHDDLTFILCRYGKL